MDLSGQFLYSHDGVTLLAATRRTGYGKRLSVYTLTDSDSSNMDGFGWPTGAFRQFASQIDLVEPETPYGHTASVFAHKGLMLASHWQQGLRSQLSLYRWAGDTTMRYTFTFPLSGSRPARLYFSTLDDYLVASLSVRPGTAPESVENVYVTPVTRDRPPGPPQFLTSIRLPQTPNHPTLALPASGTHLVYVNDAQALMTARYTGQKFTLLAENVAAVWDLNAEPASTLPR